MEVWGEEKVSWPLSLWDSMLDKADYISRRKSLFLFIPIHHSTCTLMERIRFDFLFYLETLDPLDHAILSLLAPFLPYHLFPIGEKHLDVVGIELGLVSTTSQHPHPRPLRPELTKV